MYFIVFLFLIYVCCIIYHYFFFRCCVNKNDSFKFDIMRFLSLNGILHNMIYEDERSFFWTNKIEVLRRWDNSREKSKNEDEEITVSSSIAGYYHQSFFSLSQKTYHMIPLKMKYNIPYTNFVPLQFA